MPSPETRNPKPDTRVRVYFQELEQWLDLKKSSLKLQQVWPGCDQKEVDDTLTTGSYSAYRLQDEPGPGKLQTIFAYDFIGNWSELEARRVA